MVEEDPAARGLGLVWASLGWPAGIGSAGAGPAGAGPAGKAGPRRPPARGALDSSGRLRPRRLAGLAPA